MSMLPIDFNREIPLFPLPNCVLFPGVVQPLHIFEPRYKEMVADTLGEESVMAMALLKEGWEKNYYGTPAIHDMLCVGKIVASERLDDGKYNLLLHGLSRARMVCERKQGLYRVAMLEPVPESHDDETANTRMQRRVLREMFRKTALKDLTVAQSIESLFGEAVPTARLIDVLAFTLVQDVPLKQRMLEELDPVKRGEYLLRELVGLTQLLEGKPREGAASPSAPSDPWPPGISVN